MEVNFAVRLRLGPVPSRRSWKRHGVDSQEGYWPRIEIEQFMGPNAKTTHEVSACINSDATVVTEALLFVPADPATQSARQAAAA